MLPEAELQSIPRPFRNLGSFIDRIDEYQKFDTLVKNPVKARDKFILAFYGPPGIGKSTLLQRLEFECTKRDIATVVIPLDRGGNVNIPTEIMRTIAEKLGPNGEFAAWFEKDQEWSLPAQLNTTALKQSVTTNITGDNWAVHGDFIAGDKYEIKVSQAALNPQAAQSALTQTFLKLLGEFTRNKAVVIILDGYDSEEFSQSTRIWVSENLLNKTRVFDGFGVLPVVALLNEPIFPHAKSPDPSLIEDTAPFRLKPLSREHVIEFFQRRNIAEGKIQEKLESCLADTEGIPARIYAFYMKEFFSQ